VGGSDSIGECPTFLLGGEEKAAQDVGDEANHHRDFHAGLDGERQQPQGQADDDEGGRNPRNMRSIPVVTVRDLHPRLEHSLPGVSLQLIVQQRQFLILAAERGIVRDRLADLSGALWGQFVVK